MNRICLLIPIMLLASLACRPAIQHQRQDPLKRSLSLLASGDTLSAIKSLETLLYEDFPPPASFTLLGSLLRSRGTIRKRMESQLILEKGLRLYPGDTGIRFELGKTYYAQQFYPDAARYFRKVLESDSTRCDVLHYLGRNFFRKWKRNQGFKDELEHAVSFFARAHRCNPHDSLNVFYYAFSVLALGDSNDSRSICREGLRLWADNWRLRLLSGALEYYGRRYDRASEEYDLAIALMPGGERGYYLDISLLLEDEAFASYQTARAPRRKRMERIFWIEHDPDPTTDVNERYLEHLSRKVLADLYYCDWNDPVERRTTDRGIALIKFGLPSRVEYGLGGGLTGRFEKWTYIRNEDAFQFTFMDEFLNDRFSIPMDEEHMKQELVEKASESTLIRTALSIPGRMKIYSFAHGQQLVENYLYLAIDYSGFQQLTDHSQASTLKLRTSVFDDNWTRLQHIEHSMELEMNTIGTDSTIYIAEKIDLPFGNYHFAAAFEDSLSLFQSIFRGDVHSVRFLDEALTISDLVLFKQSESPQEVPSFERNKRSITPCVYHRYRAGEKLGVYLEIYNLKKYNLRSNYEISYFIFEAAPGGTSSWAKMRSALSGTLGLSRPEAPAISQTVTYSGADHTAFESLLIDIGSLDPGRYELQISVFDLIASERTTSSVLFSCEAKK